MIGTMIRVARGAQRLLLALSAAAALTLAAAAPAASGDTIAVGGPDGRPFALQCGEAGVLVGFAASSGKALNNIRPFCRTVANGRIVGEPYQMDVVGGTDAKDFQLSYGFYAAPYLPLDREVCPGDTAVKAMQVWVDQHGAVHKLTMSCGTFPGPEMPTRPAGGAAVRSDVVYCPPGEMAYGLIGASHSMITRIGLRCRPNASPAPAAQAPPSLPAHRVTNAEPLRVDNGAGQ